MATCKCYKTRDSFTIRYDEYTGERVMTPRKESYCSGTKECDPCNCKGDESNCDFYDYVRERAKKKVEPNPSQLSPEDVKAFVLGGNATFTLQSGKTGAYFTFKVKRHKEDKDLYFVRLLVNSDNTKDYRYVACYYADRKVLHLAKPWNDVTIESCPPSIRAIKFLFNRLDDIPTQLIVYHEGRCARCGRILTTPDSIKRGFGPECYKLEDKQND